MTALPREHVERTPLPWREVTLTECGLAVADLKKVLTIDEFRQKVSEQGQQRAAFTTCMTCWHTAIRWRDQTARTGPTDALERELHRADTRRELERELYAIAALIEAHREEFDAFVAGLEQTVDLADLRAQRRYGA